MVAGDVSDEWLERAVAEAAAADEAAGVDDSDSSDDGVFLKNLRGRSGPTQPRGGGFAPATEADFHQLLGKTVVLVGLLAKPELNGATGRVMSWHTSTGRAGVKVGDKMLALKPANLACIPMSPPSSPPAHDSTVAEMSLPRFRTKFTADTDDGYAERHLIPARLELNPSGLTVTLEQTSGEERESEYMQSSVWVAAAVLAEAMQLPSEIFDGGASFWRGKRVLELGAGCGACGIVAAMCGAEQVVLTDYAALLPLLRRNAAANGVDAICQAKELEWETGPADDLLGTDGFDVIIGSDVTAFVQSLPHLASTLQRLLSASPHAFAMLSHTVRGGDVQWMIDAFDPFFCCEDVTDTCLGTQGLRARAKESAVAEASTRGSTLEDSMVGKVQPEVESVKTTAVHKDGRRAAGTRLFRIRLRAGIRSDSVGIRTATNQLNSFDADEVAAIAEYEAARKRLGLKVS